MGAVLRVVNLPSTNLFRQEQHQEHSFPTLSSMQSSLNSQCISKRSKANFNLSWCLSPRSSPSVIGAGAFAFKIKRFSRLALQFSSTSQEQATSSSLSSVISKPGALEEETEEFSSTRLIAQNVPWSCSPEDIRSLFEKYGTVLDVELSMYNKTKNRGLAFVSMGSPEEASAALKNLESYEFKGRILRVNYARPKKEKRAPPVQRKPVTFNLFVENLSYEARAKDLREFFDSGSGNVVSAHIIFRDNPRRSSGYGFVAFKSKKDAEAALAAFNEKVLMGRPIRVARSRQFVRLPREEDTEVEIESADVETESAGYED